MVIRQRVIKKRKHMLKQFSYKQFGNLELSEFTGKEHDLGSIDDATVWPTMPNCYLLLQKT